MRRIIFLILLVLISSLTTANEVYTIGEDKTEKASMNIVNYEPLPASAGEEVTVYLKLRNLDGSDISNLKLILEESYPFTIYSDSSIRNIPNLRKDETTLLTYKLRVADDATEGENYLKFKYVTPKGSWTIDDVKINIKSEGGTLSIDDIITNPERVSPGEKVNINLILKNNANSFVKDIKVNLNLDSLTSFTPIGSTSEKRINSLGSDQSENLQFSLIVDPNTQTKAYRIPITIEYYDNTNVKQTSTHIIGVVVDSKADYQLDIEDTEVYTKWDIGTVTASLSNIGTSDLKFLTLEILEDENYEIISNPRVYLGNLEPDDFKTAEYKIQSASNKDIKLKFNVIYKDSYNKPFEEEREVNLKIFSNNEAVSYGLKKRSNGFINTLIYLLILLFIYKVYKQWKLEKDLEISIKKVSIKWYKNLILFIKNLIKRMKK